MRFHKNHRAVNRDEVKVIVEMWDDHTTREIAEKLKTTRKRIEYAALCIRDVDANALAMKHAKGYLTEEVVAGIMAAKNIVKKRPTKCPKCGKSFIRLAGHMVRSHVKNVG